MCETVISDDEYEIIVSGTNRCVVGTMRVACPAMLILRMCI